MTFRELPSRAALPLCRFAGVVGIGLLVANCSNAPGGRHYASREIGAFPESKYGPASPRVVSNGERAPKGGGRYLLGKTYSVAGRSYTPRENPHYSAVGLASWYGDAFHGRRTANGEVYDMSSISAAHPTMPLPSYARVTNLRNHASIIVRVNDRGPFHGHRIMDVSERVAHYLDFKRYGTAQVRVDYLGPASMTGSDDRKLVATLRTNGDLAPSPLSQSPVMVASAEKTLVDRAAYDGGNFALASAANASGDVESRSSPRPVPVEVAPAPAPAPVLVASNVPLPPDRPFEVGTGSRLVIASALPAQVRPASPPVQVASLSRPVSGESARRLPEQALGFAGGSPSPQVIPAAFTSTAQMAALYYAPTSEPVRARFGKKGDPMARLKTAGIVPLSAVGRQPNVVEGDFVVAAGIFRDEANARRLARALGHLANLRQIELGGQAAWQVTVGPFAEAAKAQAMREQAVRAGASGAMVKPRQG